MRNLEKLVPSEIKSPTFPPEDEQTQHEVFNVSGPESESLYLGFRFPGTSTKDAKMVKLIDYILANSTAGLIDLNLNQKQKVLDASSFAYGLNDYTVHILSGEPREGQSLEEVSALLLDQIDLIRKGEFDENLLEAIFNDMEKDQMRGYERNWSRCKCICRCVYFRKRVGRLCQ